MRRFAPLLAPLLVVACLKLDEPVAPYAAQPVNIQWANLGMACALNAPAVALPSPQRDSLGAPTVNDIDLMWANLSLTVPGGWGGFYYADGVPRIYLVDTTARVDAIAALRAANVSVPTNAVAVQGRYYFDELYDWHRFLASRTALTRTMSDLQETENRIVLYVASEAWRPLLEARLRELHVPCGLVAIGVGSERISAR